MAAEQQALIPQVRAPVSTPAPATAAAVGVVVMKSWTLLFAYTMSIGSHPPTTATINTELTARYGARANWPAGEIHVVQADAFVPPGIVPPAEQAASYRIYAVTSALI